MQKICSQANKSDKFEVSVAIHRNTDFKYYVRNLDCIQWLLHDHIVRVKRCNCLRICYNIIENYPRLSESK